MNEILYFPFDQIDALELIPVLNESSVRNHLVTHPRFDAANIFQWVESKRECDRLPGCCSRVIVMDGKPVGWCGIQPDADDFELAMVLSRACWGIGPSVFRTLCAWAGELGHSSVMIHLLETRPEYRFLARKAVAVGHRTMLGRRFNSYRIAVACK